MTHKDHRNTNSCGAVWKLKFNGDHANIQDVWARSGEPVLIIWLLHCRCHLPCHYVPFPILKHFGIGLILTHVLLYDSTASAS